MQDISDTPLAVASRYEVMKDWRSLPRFSIIYFEIQHTHRQILKLIEGAEYFWSSLGSLEVMKDWCSLPRFFS